MKNDKSKSEKLKIENKLLDEITEKYYLKSQFRSIYHDYKQLIINYFLPNFLNKTSLLIKYTYILRGTKNGKQSNEINTR